MFWKVRTDIEPFSEIIGEDCPGTHPMQFLDPDFYPNEKPAKPEDIKFSFDKTDIDKIPDFIDPAFGTFVCKPEITRLFDGIFETHCRTIDIVPETELYQIHVVKNELDAISWELSTYKYQGGDKNLPHIRKLRLQPKFETDLDLFRLAGPIECKLTIIASDRFKEIYERNNLTGLLFSKTMEVLH